MAKKLTIFTVGTLTLLIVASPSIALGLDYSLVEGTIQGNISSDTNLVDTVFRVINWILAVSAAAAVIFLIIGGFRYITAAGNSDIAEDAKKTISSAIIGLVVILLAYVIGATINTVILGQAS